MGRPRVNPLPPNVPKALPRGVYWLQGRYVAQLGRKYLGRFRTVDEAVKARAVGVRGANKKPGPPKMIGPQAPRAGLVRRVSTLRLVEIFASDEEFC